MKSKLSSFLIIMFIFMASVASAELDLEQEVLIIPNTHDDKPYIWQVRRNPGDYKLDMSHEKTGEGYNISVAVLPKAGGKIENLHVFITDRDLKAYEHLIPSPNSGGRYSFTYAPPFDDKYRFEVVFQTSEGWVSIKKDIKLKTAPKAFIKPTGYADRDYDVKVKFIPGKVYAEHVVTFLYEISYKHQPVKDLEKIDGFDMQVGSWNQNMREFIYATPKQNLGGPEVAVSLVFMQTGRHVIFSEFMHKGVKRIIELAVDVYREPEENGGINTLQPSFY